ncbi:MAG TPA: TlpA disulfide reductase family protein [Conexibacter sp.]|nr:TlpA disulfide reductase family protein [Conexibacter sp.]
MRRIVTTLAASLIALLLVGLLVFGVLQTGDDSSIDQALARGQHPRAHDAALPLLDGGKRTLADYRGDGYVLVNFFASWCPPCEDEAPLLDRIQRRIAGRGTIVGVAWNDASGDTRRFVRKHDVRYPVLRDVDGSFAGAYGVKAMPESFLLDPHGHIVALERSELTSRWVSAYLDPLIASRGRQ